MTEPADKHEVYVEEDGTITHRIADDAIPDELFRPDHIVSGGEVGVLFVGPDMCVLLTLSLHGETERAVLAIDAATARTIGEGLVKASERTP